MRRSTVLSRPLQLVFPGLRDLIALAFTRNMWPNLMSKIWLLEKLNLTYVQKYSNIQRIQICLLRGTAPATVRRRKRIFGNILPKLH